MKNFLLISTLLTLTACASDPVLYAPQEQSRDLFDSDIDGVINARDNCERTQADAVTNNDGCPTETNIPHADIRVIDFGFDKDTLTPQEQIKVIELAETMKQEPETQLYLIGDTSVEGTEEYNRKLAQRRIKTVTDILLANGVSSSRFETETYEYPIHMPKALAGRDTRLIAVLSIPDSTAFKKKWQMYDDK